MTPVIIISGFIAFVGMFMLSPLAAIRFVIVSIALLGVPLFLLMALEAWSEQRMIHDAAGLIHTDLMLAGASFVVAVVVASIGNK